MSTLSSREEQIFVQALALPVAERAAFVAQACGADEKLHARVALLLRAHEEAQSFMETPPDATPARWSRPSRRHD